MQEPVVTVDTLIAADAATVWKAMTRRASAMFPGTKVETDWQIGHPISFSGKWKGKAFKDRGEIQSLKMGRELSFSHWSETPQTPEKPENYHIVRYELRPQGQKTKVILSQINVGPDSDIDEKTKDEFKKNWAMMLDGLKKSAEAH
ncbi:MAG: hypothetical protein JWN11_2139 [Hyphomicrobiales bacterium]|nr:hypothetical protein [Hyphomicrobiales bacterium]